MPGQAGHAVPGGPAQDRPGPRQAPRSRVVQGSAPERAERGGVMALLPQDMAKGVLRTKAVRAVTWAAWLKAS